MEVSLANIADHLFRHACNQPDKAAIHFEGQTLHFGELASRVRRAAGGLGAIGVSAGVHVGVMIPSSVDFIISQQAVFALGATFTPLNIFSRPNEILHAIASCGLNVLVIASDYLDRLPEQCLSALKAVVVVGAGPMADDPRLMRADDLIASSNRIESLADLPLDATAMMLSTSATTGKAKGVMLSVANIQANYDRTPSWLGLDGDTITLCALPLYNTFGLNQCINALMVTGGTLVLLPRFDPLACIRAIEGFGCTFLPAVPTMLQKIIDHPEVGSHDISSISRIMTGGAPVPASLIERVRALMGPDTTIITGYGLTECTALASIETVTLDGQGKVRNPKSIGKPLPGIEMRIAAEDGCEAAVGVVGEIRLRGTSVMQGYYRLPEETAAAMADGWLCTGDLGIVDESGNILIVDRKKDIIIRGGQNIYPADIEEVIYQVPGVCEVAVIAAADEMLGEVPVAFVAIHPGAAVEEEDILARCRDHLARYKVPASVIFLTELPKGPTGKILRRALRPEAGASLQTHSGHERRDCL
jgi:long-chain acyl-CoA synthetase